MKLVEFSVKNYRSIIQKRTIQIKDNTVIIAPNNKEKSDVIRALVLAFRILGTSYLFCNRPYSNRNFPMDLLFDHLKRWGVDFDWKDDYPHSLKGKDSKQRVQEPICLTLTFDLNENDKDILSKDLEMKFNMDRVSFVIKMSDSDCLLEIQNGFEKHFSEKSYIVAKYIAVHNKICLIDARDTLGVFLSDTLMFANNNIFVEGASDEKILKSVLSAISPKIEASFKSGELKIIYSGGCSRISSFASLMKVYISNFCILLDSDKAGMEVKEKLEERETSLSKRITLFTALGMSESEIEDFVDPECYTTKFATAFSINNIETLKKALDDTNNKWSTNLSNYGIKNGHPFDMEKMIQAKTIVADTVEEKKLDALRDCRKDIFYTLAENIEKMLDEQPMYF